LNDIEFTERWAVKKELKKNMERKGTDRKIDIKGLLIKEEQI
jgi:hypothetical protein